MPTPPLSHETIMERLGVVAAIASEGGFFVHPEEPQGRVSAIEEAHRRGHGDAAQFRRAVDYAQRILGITWRDVLEPAKEPATEGEEHIDPDAIIERLIKGKAAADKVRLNRHNLRIPVRPEPFAVAFIGDPHLDSAGCNHAQLWRDMALLRAAKVRAVNMGDILDNWPTGGKLAKKLHHSPLTRPEALALARKFIVDTGVRFDAHILGNHDEWPGDDYAALLSGWAAEASTRLVPWGLTITYVCGETEFRIQAHHDFTGHSMYNPLHGLMRRAREEGRCHLYVAGHRHNAATGGYEDGHRGKRYNFMRVKGYKEGDEYAFVKGYAEQREGHSGLAVFNPWAETLEGQCRTFLDIADGVAFLEALRNRGRDSEIARAS